MKVNRSTTKPVTRLLDMKVEEVSVVDRAANKRRFLVTKVDEDEEGAMSGAGSELVPDGKGGLTAKQQDDTPPPPPPDDVAAAAAVEKAKNSGVTLAETADTLMDLANKIKGGEDPTKHAEELKLLMTAIGSVIERYPAPKSKAASAEEAGPDGKPKVTEKAAKANSGSILQSAVERLMSVANKVTEGGDPGANASELKAIASLISGVVDSYPSPQAKVEKMGARIAKERLARFKAALQTLQDLAKEFEPETTPEEPSAGIAEAAAKRNESAAASTPSAPVPDDAVRKEFSELAKSVFGLTKIVKVQQDQLDRMMKQAPSSAQAPVSDGASQGAFVGKRVCSWPKDLNRPLDRDHTPADISFHDV